MDRNADKKRNQKERKKQKKKGDKLWGKEPKLNELDHVTS